MRLCGSGALERRCGCGLCVVARILTVVCVPKASLEFRTLEAAAAALVAGRTTFANPLKSLHADEARLLSAAHGIDHTVRRASHA